MKRSRSSKYLKNLYRRVLYRRAISKSDKVALYTPSTEEIISNITGSFWYKNYRNKQINSSLGFDNNDYYFDPQLRYSKRSSLGIKNDEIVLIYSSRVVRNKGLEIILKAVDECITEGHKLKMIIIGLFDDLYGFKIRKDISIIKNQGNFILFGFLNQKEINEYFNCADAGIWGQASISIQQAMGTGLFVLLPQRKSVSHLITENLNGAYYKDILTLKKRIKLLTDNDKRDEIVLFNQKFNNLILCQDILTRTFNDLAT